VDKAAAVQPPAASHKGEKRKAQDEQHTDIMDVQEAAATGPSSTSAGKSLDAAPTGPLYPNKQAVLAAAKGHTSPPLPVCFTPLSECFGSRAGDHFD